MVNYSRKNRYLHLKYRIILSYILILTGASLNNHCLATGSTINLSIIKLKSQLSSNHKRRQNLIDQIKNDEATLGKIINNINLKQKTITAHTLKLQRLRNNQVKLQLKLKQLHHNLNKDIRVTYIMHNRSTLSRLITQQQNIHQQINMNYYKNIQQSQLKLINTTKETLHESQNNEKKIRSATALLAEKLKQQQANKRHLKTNQKKRKTAITSLNSVLTQQAERLKQLIINKKRLEAAVDKLKSAQDTSANTTSFKRLKMHLPWPTQGKTLYKFGSRIGTSQLTRAGMLIQTPSGSPVHAIAAGTIIFSKWLMGYGNLLIINHNNGYISIYGHNQLMLKHIGDKVTQGETIALAGNTGGQIKSALYFAIRHNSIPLDPANWCSKSHKNKTTKRKYHV